MTQSLTNCKKRNKTRIGQSMSWDSRVAPDQYRTIVCHSNYVRVPCTSGLVQLHQNYISRYFLYPPFLSMSKCKCVSSNESFHPNVWSWTPWLFYLYRDVEWPLYWTVRDKLSESDPRNRTKTVVFGFCTSFRRLPSLVALESGIIFSMLIWGRVLLCRPHHRSIIHCFQSKLVVLVCTSLHSPLFSDLPIVLCLLWRYRFYRRGVHS